MLWLVNISLVDTVTDFFSLHLKTRRSDQPEKGSQISQVTSYSNGIKYDRDVPDIIFDFFGRSIDMSTCKMQQLSVLWSFHSFLHIPSLS